MQPKLINQELQTSSYSKSNINLSFINSLSYLCADNHKINDYSYPRVTAIWINVHPARENLINTPYASYDNPYMAIFHVVINRVRQILCSRETSAPDANLSPAE
jgi:hypothetical protein